MSLFVIHRPQGAALGASVMIATTFVMALGDALVKYVSSDFSLWQIYVVRSRVAIPLIIGLLLLTTTPTQMMPRSLGWTAVRCLLLMGIWMAFYAALPFLSLAVVAATYYTAPLFIALFAALLIGDPIGLRRWIAIVLGFTGVMVILRPGTEAFSYLAVLPIVSAVFYALAAIVTRQKCIDEKPLVLSLALNVSFMLVGAVASIAVAQLGSPSPGESAHPFFLSPWTELGLREWLVAGLLAMVIVASSAGVAKAYQSGPPAIIATFDYTYLVFAALWGLVIFSEVPDAATVLGMMLISGAGLIVISGPDDQREVSGREARENSLTARPPGGRAPRRFPSAIVPSAISWFRTGTWSTVPRPSSSRSPWTGRSPAPVRRLRSWQRVAPAARGSGGSGGAGSSIGTGGQSYRDWRAERLGEG